MMRARGAALVIVAAGACGSDNGTGPGPASLAGTWRATRAEFVSTANPSVKVELIGQGATLELVLNGNNTFTLTVAAVGEPAEVWTGTWSSSSDILTLAPTGMTGGWTFDMTLSGTTLTLSGADVEFDLNGDGVDDPARLNLVLVRQAS